MKVVMLLGRSTGGIGTHVAQLSADLRDRGVDVIVVTHPLTAARFDLGPVRLWWPGSAGWVRALRDFRLLRRLASTSDIVHAHGHQGALLATLSTLGTRDARKKPKLIVSQHNAVLEGSGRQGLKRLAQRWVARRADLVTGASSDLVKEALAFGAGRAELAEVPSPRVPELLAQPPADAAARARIRRACSPRSPLTAWTTSTSRCRWSSRSRGSRRRRTFRCWCRRLPGCANACTWVVLGDGDPQLLAQLRAQARAGRARPFRRGAQRRRPMAACGRGVRPAERVGSPGPGGAGGHGGRNACGCHRCRWPARPGRRDRTARPTGGRRRRSRRRPTVSWPTPVCALSSPPAAGRLPRRCRMGATRRPGGWRGTPKPC